MKHIFITALFVQRFAGTALPQTNTLGARKNRMKKL